jgi:hypothetical protein
MILITVCIVRVVDGSIVCLVRVVSQAVLLVAVLSFKQLMYDSMCVERVIFMCLIELRLHAIAMLPASRQ